MFKNKQLLMYGNQLKYLEQMKREFFGSDCHRDSNNTDSNINMREVQKQNIQVFTGEVQKLNESKKLCSAFCLSATQVKELMGLLVQDMNRYELARHSVSKLSDPENNYILFVLKSILLLFPQINNVLPHRRVILFGDLTVGSATFRIFDHEN
jgi:hypothetical protein